jgi:osmotically-inducible protein OsmY
MRNDLQIQQDVLGKLRENNIPADTIGVEVHHGVVKLAGRVSNFAIRKNAELAARRVEDVTTVIMDIDVDDSGTARHQAPQLAKQLRARS